MANKTLVSFLFLVCLVNAAMGQAFRPNGFGTANVGGFSGSTGGGFFSNLRNSFGGGRPGGLFGGGRPGGLFGGQQGFGGRPGGFGGAAGLGGMRPGGGLFGFGR